MYELTMNEVEQVSGGIATGVAWFTLGVIASEMIREVRQMPAAVRTGPRATRAR